MTKPPKGKPPKAVVITHGERIVYPDCGVTKGEIFDYYAAVADRLAPHLKGRPVSIVRAPESIAETFFQRHPLRGMEASVTPVEVGDETYMALDGAGGLATAAQFGAIELHGWMSRVDALDRPDRMVFDLDPDEGLAFAEVVRAAQDIAKALREFDLKTWPMISGGKGRACRAAARRASRIRADGGVRQGCRAGSGGARAATVRGDDEQTAAQGPYLRRLAPQQEIGDRHPAVVAARASRRACGDSHDVGRTRLDDFGVGFDIHTAVKRKDPWRGFFTTRQRLPGG